MEALIMAGQLILALSILVSLHELGHFLAARMFGIRVEKFYVFFDAWGFKLFNIKRGDTEYGIGWLPLGGYVKISGMIDESMDKEFTKHEPKDYEFRSKPAWQRFIVMVAGVFVNVILGIFIFSMMTFNYGESYLPAENMEHGIVAHEVGEKAGLKTGDRVIKVNDRPLKRFDELTSREILFGDGNTITVLRNGSEHTVELGRDFLRQFTEAGGQNFVEPRFPHFIAEVVPGSHADDAGLQPEDRILKVNDDSSRFFDQLQRKLRENAGETVVLTVQRGEEIIELTSRVSDEGMLGFRPGSELEYETRYYGFFKSFSIGTSRAVESLVVTIRGLGTVITGKVSAHDALHGPIGIAQVFGGVWDWQKFWLLTGLLSMVLAFMNILPIPALDGGHAMFLTIEMVRGKPLSDKVMEVAQVIGIVLLLSLMVFVFYVDLARFF